MSRKEKMVTRTFKVSDVLFMVFAMDRDNTIYDMTDTVNGTFNESEALLKIRDKWETDTLRVVAVKSVMHREVLRGMTETVFLAYSVELPPRTKDDMDIENI